MFQFHKLGWRFIFRFAGLQVCSFVGQKTISSNLVSSNHSLCMVAPASLALPLEVVFSGETGSGAGIASSSGEARPCGSLLGIASPSGEARPCESLGLGLPAGVSNVRLLLHPRSGQSGLRCTLQTLMRNITSG